MQVAELKQEAGKISNLDLQRKVVRVFYYLCVVTLQYTAPMILILYLSFLYKTLGGGSWTGGLVQGPGDVQEQVKEAGDEFQEVQVDTEDMDIGIGSVINQEESVEAIKHQFSLAWNSVKNVSKFALNKSYSKNPDAGVHPRGVQGAAGFLHLVVLLRLVLLGRDRRGLPVLLLQSVNLTSIIPTCASLLLLSATLLKM